MTKERQRQTYYGAINVRTRTVPLQEQPSGEGSSTVTFRQWCQSRYPDKKFLVLWDGASYHRGAEMQPFLAQENAGVAEAEWKVTCLRFAPNAPEQNPTEDLWLKGKTFLRKHFAVNKTFAAVKQCFLTFLQTRSFNSKKFRWYWPDPQLI
jgi:transposase